MSTFVKALLFLAVFFIAVNWLTGGLDEVIKPYDLNQRIEDSRELHSP